MDKKGTTDETILEMTSGRKTTSDIKVSRMVSTDRMEDNMHFIEGIKQRAKQDIKTIVLPESEDKRVLTAAAQVLKEGTAKLIMLGDEAKIQDGAKWLDVDLTDLTIINPAQSPKLDEYIELLYQIRKEKGMTLELARENLTTNNIMYGVMMVKAGDADGMVSGACHATADVLRPSLQILKTAPGTPLVSGILVMDVPECDFGDNGLICFADCALNQDPTSEQLADIAYSSAKTFRTLLGKQPVVALLSHSTLGSAHHPMVDKVVEATRIAKEKYPSLIVDGELQADAALVPEIAHIKAPNSPVAGKANILILPNLDVGNIVVKIGERLGKAEAYGPILQGIAKPVNDLSRGCCAADIAGMIAITAVQAQL
jgi:phosphate acetyltransferase